MKGILQKVQRFGGAMYTPVLLFSFAGVMVGLSTLFLNQEIFGTLTAEESLWYRIWYIIQEGSWVVFRQLPLLFVIGLPIGLAKKQNARCVMEAFVIYVTFNYFLSAILNFWGADFGIDFAAETGGTSGLTMICGIKTLDTGMIGALIISGIVVWIHNRYFDKELPEILGVFAGSAFVVIIGFAVMLPTAFIFAAVWPKVQGVMLLMQTFFKESGELGVGMYAFCEKILLPTGLHHFIYSPFTLDSAVVPGGIDAYWPLHLGEFASSTEPLKELFPAGGFALFGNAKVFAPIGITLAFYITAKKEKRKQVMALMVPAALTAMLTGITEPIEFTFLFIAPVLFLAHAILCALINAVMYAVGVSGAFGNGLIAWLSLNWIPLGKNHWQTYVIQVVVGLLFSALWFLVFRFLITKFNFQTPGREADDEDARLYTKKDYKAKKAAGDLSYAATILQYLGGRENIVDVTNCATRLRVNVKDSALVFPEKAFKAIGAHGLSVSGNAIQVIVGLRVPKVRGEFEECLEMTPEALAVYTEEMPGQDGRDEKKQHVKEAQRKNQQEKNQNEKAQNREAQYDKGKESGRVGEGYICAPVNGTVVTLEEVPDKTFSEKMLGDGVAMLPEDGLVVCPVKGEVILVAETKHAYAVAAENGAEILVHIGLDTVNLKGEGFEALVKAGDKVEVGTPLCKVSESLWKDKEIPLFIPVIITNSNEFEKIEISTGKAEAGETCIVKYSYSKHSI